MLSNIDPSYWGVCAIIIIRMATQKKKKSEIIAEKWDNTDRWIKRVMGLIGTFGAIAGIVAGVMGFFVGQLDSYLDQKLEGISTQIEDLRAESAEGDRVLTVSNTRVELMVLMNTDPTNVVAIERMARYYFVTLNGDQYMSGLYSDWARQYGGDTSFVLK